MNLFLKQMCVDSCNRDPPASASLRLPVKWTNQPQAGRVDARLEKRKAKGAAMLIG